MAPAAYGAVAIRRTGVGRLRASSHIGTSMFMIHFYGFILFAYVTIRLIAPLDLPRMAKIALAALVFIVSQHHGWLRLSGSLASPELPYYPLILTSWLFISLALLFVLLLARDAVLLVRFLARKAGFLRPRPFSPGRRALGAAGIALVLGGVSVRQAMQVPNVRRSDVLLDRLPPEMDGLSLVHITDLHATKLLHGPRVAAVVERVNALNPDIILCTGDMVDGATNRREADVAPLAGLRARLGVYACEGNHEYYSGYADWMRAFTALGLTILHNSHVTVRVGGKPLVIAGLNDPVGPGFGQPGPDAAKALSGVPKGAPVILLAHRPGMAPQNAVHGVDLQLSGHTHGGQIVGFDQIVAANNNGFVAGWYTVGAMRLYVNRGAGLWTGFPTRLGVPGEIAHIVLHSPGRT